MMKRFCLLSVILLCCTGIAAGAWGMFFSLQAAHPDSNVPQQTTYCLRDCGGRIAVYSQAQPDAPLAVYNVYVNLLPEWDALRLKDGVEVQGEQNLEQLLEDLGA